MSHPILGKHILLVTAHPDDEAFLAAGIIHRNKQHSGRTTVWCATHGERGTSYLTDPITPDQLAALRAQELAAVASHLGIDTVALNHFPDGQLELHHAGLHESLDQFVDNHAPDIIISFGDDGYTGHRDHIAVGSVSVRIARSKGIPIYAFAKPPSDLFTQFDSYFLKKRKQGTYITATPSRSTPHIHIPSDPTIKLASLKLHTSQFTGLNPYTIFPPEVAEHFLRSEYVREV